MKYTLIVVLFVIAQITWAQEPEKDNPISNPITENVYVDFYVGTQMSGIRKEDFQANIFSPYIHFSVGKRLTSFMALSVNYQGPFFRYISDDFKHKYLFLSADLTIEPLRLFTSPDRVTNFHLYFFGGVGYFYNYFYQRPLLGLNVGVTCGFQLNDNYELKLKIGAIAGWKIYQHDKDALPNLSIGVSRKF